MKRTYAKWIVIGGGLLASVASNASAFEGLSASFSAGPTSTTWRGAILGTNPPENKRISNAALGVTIGYDIQWGAMWFGPTAGVSYYTGPNYAESNMQVASRWSLQFGGRLGVHLTPRIFAFATAGASFRYKQSGYLSGPALTPLVSVSGWSPGYYLGGGLGMRISPHVSSAIEYRFVDHGGHRNKIPSVVVQPNWNSPFSHQLTIGLAFHL